MGSRLSLVGVIGKLAVKRGQKQLSLMHKNEVGGFNGAGNGGGRDFRFRRQLGQPVSPFGFPEFPTNIGRQGLPPPIQFQPVVRDPFDPRRETPQGGIGEAACNLLSGTARDLCLLGLQFIPNGNGEKQIVPTDCPPGMVKVGETCVDLTALPPGGDPAFIPSNGFATVGAFGLPALTPASVARTVRKCGRGMVLGIDNLCYPKAVLTGRSKFRKWRRPVRAPVTRRDVVAIRRAAGARDRVLELAKDVGLSVSKIKRAPRRHSKKHD